MVEVTFVKTARGYEEYHSTGHAEYSPGNDIVCAAVSALSYMLAGALRCIDGLTFRSFQCANGMDIVINPFIDEARQIIADTVFKTALIGLQQVSNTYPENVSVSVKSNYL